MKPYPHDHAPFEASRAWPLHGKLHDILSLYMRKHPRDKRPVKKMLKAIGNPENAFKTVIVSGTNGKGSVAAMLLSILRNAGLTAGSFTSPHIDYIGERVLVNGEMISEDDIARIFAEMKPKLRKSWTISFFEALMGVALKYFKERAADYAVLEVGIGGKLDATNNVDPVVSVVVSVDLDHTNILGNTVEKIADDKAHILRDNGVLVTMERKPNVIRVFERHAKKHHARLLRVGIDASVEPIGVSDARNTYRIRTSRGVYAARLRLLGEHQGQNAAVAVLAAEALNDPRITKSAIERGLAEAFIPARLEAVRKKPLVLMDAAHNPAAMGSLVRALALFKYDRLILVTGMMADKDIASTMKLIAPHCEVVIATKSRAPRAAEAEFVAKQAKKWCAHVETIPDVTQAKRRALCIAKPNDCILVAGSIYVLSEVRGVDDLRLGQ